MAAALMAITLDERTYREPLALFAQIEGVDLKRVRRELLLLVVSVGSHFLMTSPNISAAKRQDVINLTVDILDHYLAQNHDPDFRRACLRDVLSREKAYAKCIEEVIRSPDGKNGAVLATRTLCGFCDVSHESGHALLGSGFALANASERISALLKTYRVA
jgi:hypothetical protein